MAKTEKTLDDVYELLLKLQMEVRLANQPRSTERSFSELLYLPRTSGDGETAIVVAKD